MLWGFGGNLGFFGCAAASTALRGGMLGFRGEYRAVPSGLGAAAGGANTPPPLLTPLFPALPQAAERRGCSRVCAAGPRGAQHLGMNTYARVCINTCTWTVNTH